MKINKVKKLLSNFYEGKTSLEEEKELQQYFNTHRVPDKLLPDKQQFFYLCEKKRRQSPVKLEKQLNDLIDQWAGKVDDKPTKIYKNRYLFKSGRSLSRTTKSINSCFH